MAPTTEEKHPIAEILAPVPASAGSPPIAAVATAPGQKSNERPSLDVVSAEMNALREFQLSSADGLDTKGGVLLGFLGTVLTILAGRPVPEQSNWLVAAFAVICVGVLAAVFALFVRSYRADPKPLVLKQEYMYLLPDAPGIGAKEKLLADKIEAYSKNETSLANKAFCINIAALCLALGVIFSAVPNLIGGIMSNNTPASAVPVPVPPAEPNPSAANSIPKGGK